MTIDRASLPEEALRHHYRHRGEVAVQSKVDLKDLHVLSRVYNPGAAEPAKEIAEDPSKAMTMTVKGNLVAVVSDGSAVLGLGNIGPEAAMPVMEGKAILLKTFAGVDAVPLCLKTQDVDQIVRAVTALAPAFGGINLEDIASPRCFEVESRLRAALDIPVMHDDQHATAIVVLAALTNALRVTGKTFQHVRVVISGTGAAGMAAARLLLHRGVVDLILSDEFGLLVQDRPTGMNPIKAELAAATNPRHVTGTLAHGLVDADVFIGLSVGGIVTSEMVSRMAPGAVVFALANPDPEIDPRSALQAGAQVVGTGRSDFPNQINNVLAFPGIFRGALDVQATAINEAMKLAAADAIAGLVPPRELSADKILPKARDLAVAPAVAAAVARAAMESGVARQAMDPQEIAENTRRMIYEG